MAEEERVVFDILTRPAQELITEERAEVRKVARDLLARLRGCWVVGRTGVGRGVAARAPAGLLVLDWRRKVGACAQLQQALDNTVDAGLPRADTSELWRQKCSAVFEHGVENHAGPGTAGAA